MNLWNKLVARLEKDFPEYSFSALSPQQDINVLQYIFKKTSIDEKVIFEALADIVGLEIFSDEVITSNDFYSTTNFILANDTVYFTNPFNKSVHIFADETARKNNRVIKKIQ